MNLRSSDSLALVTSAATTVDVDVAYNDEGGGATGNGSNTATAITTATTTTIQVAPTGAFVRRCIKSISICNKDSSSNTVTVRLVDTGGSDGTAATVQLYKVTLAAGDALYWNDGDGWTVAAVTTPSGLETVSAPGALSTTAGHTHLEIDGTDAFTLADGANVGDLKRISVITAANTPVGTLTLNGAQAAYGSEPTAYVFNGVGQYLVLEWTSTGWKFVEGGGAETRTSGACGLPFATHYLSVTNTVAFTLADGLRIGQRKRVECSAVSGTPLGTLTINDAAGSEPTAWVFTTVGQAIVLEWTSGGWKLLELNQIGTDSLLTTETANPLCLVHFVNLNGSNDYIQSAGIISGQRSRWMATAGSTASTISGLFYDEDASADGIDVNMDAAGDLAVLEWVGARWLATTLVSATVST